MTSCRAVARGRFQVAIRIVDEAVPRRDGWCRQPESLQPYPDEDPSGVTLDGSTHAQRT